MANPKLMETYERTLPLSSEELCQFYDEWAGTYTEDYKRFGYEGPRVTAETLAEYLQDRNAKILDLGCGTGMAGEQLLKYGFSNIHALDMSRKSLKICEEKQLYQTYTCSKIDGNPTDIESESFDALISSGTFIQSHMNQSCFPEMIRLVKSGGLIVITTREEYLWKAPDFNDNKLEGAISKMADGGKWEVLLRKTFPNSFKDKDGIIFVFERT